MSLPFFTNKGKKNILKKTSGTKNKGLPQHIFAAVLSSKNSRLENYFFAFLGNLFNFFISLFIKHAFHICFEIIFKSLKSNLILISFLQSFLLVFLSPLNQALLEQYQQVHRHHAVNMDSLPRRMEQGLLCEL